MQSSEYWRESSFRDYFNSSNFMEKKLRNIYETTKRITFGFKEIVIDLQTSIDNNKSSLWISIEEAVSDAKRLINDAFEMENSNFNNENNQYGLEKFSPINFYRKHRLNNIDDALIIENEENINYSEKSIIKGNYNSSINKILSESSGLIYDVAKSMAGKLFNSYNIKSRLPVRMWRWEQRIEYVRGSLSGSNLSESEKGMLSKLRGAVFKNKYLKSKRKDIFKELDDYLSQYAS